MILNSYYICCLWKVKYYRHPPQKVSLVHIQAASIERERSRKKAFKPKIYAILSMHSETEESRKNTISIRSK